jgi:arylsulfatase A-like enzyme
MHAIASLRSPRQPTHARRRSTGLVAWLLVVATVAIGCGSAHDARPDIVLIVVDTLRADHVSLYGHERATTPHIDALAAEGSWFPRAYAHSSWTLPSMASLLTGLLPHQHRAVRDPDHKRRFGRLEPEVETVAEQLAAAGYAPGAVVNNTFFAPMFGLDQGFGSSWNQVGSSNHTHRSAPATVDAALAWLRDQQAPVFLLLHFMEPHLLYDPPAAVRGVFTGPGVAPVPVPWGLRETQIVAFEDGRAPPPEHIEYIEKLYDEEIHYVDRAIGQLLDALRARSRWPQTVVIVTADHGEEFFERGGFEHGHSLYGELTRVPLVVAGPGMARGEVDDVVQHVDVAEGILALGGLARDGSEPDLFTSLRAGTRWPERGVLSDNVLYGRQRVAWSDGALRLHLRVDDGTRSVWRLDESGVEAQRLGGSESRSAARRLADELRAVRGDLEPIRPLPGPALDDPEIFEQLKSMGYAH